MENLIIKNNKNTGRFGPQAQKEALFDGATSDEKEKSWRHHGKLIDELAVLLHEKGSRSIRIDHKALIRRIQESFKQLLQLKKDERLTDEGCLQAPTLVTPGRQRDKTHLKPVIQNYGKAPSVISTPVSEKRKVRTPPSVEAELKKPKTGSAESILPDDSKGEEWVQVSRKKKITQHKKIRGAKGRILPNAFLIKARDESHSYADILRRVKQDLPESEAEGNIEKIRRTASGQLLIVLNKNIGDKLEPLHTKMTEMLKEEADVIRKTQETDLDIRDIEETSTREDVLAALDKVSPGIAKGSVRSLRKGYGGTLTAAVRLPIEIARKIMGERGRLRVGLVNCRVREVNRPPKCFKCWHFGHVSVQCKSRVDRSKCCVKCGAEGHKVAECKNEAKCLLCLERGGGIPEDHVAGNFKCLVAREETQKAKP